jgi:uncharacterized membrane protein
MAKKKVAKKVTMKNEPECSTQGCNCKGILALVIIILTWWQPAIMWSQITITIAAALILLTAHGCYCKK